MRNGSYRKKKPNGNSRPENIWKANNSPDGVTGLHCKRRDQASEDTVREILLNGSLEGGKH